MTKIGWTHWPGYIGVTLNFTGGCTHVHEGCRNCYAERMTFRLPHMGMSQYAGLAKKTDAGVKFTGDVRLFPDVLGQIAKWKAPRCVFVNSMSDLFQEKVPRDFIFSIWKETATVNMRRTWGCQTPHVFLFLTKRPERMAALWNEWAGEELGPKIRTPYFGFGTSVSDQNTAEMMIPPLLQIQHGFRFVSVEPMIGPVRLDKLEDDELGADWNAFDAGLDWVLCGCESGPKRRPMDPAWARSLRDQCADAEVPFYLKQMDVGGKVVASPKLDGAVHAEFPAIGAKP